MFHRPGTTDVDLTNEGWRWADLGIDMAKILIPKSWAAQPNFPNNFFWDLWESLSLGKSWTENIFSKIGSAEAGIGSFKGGVWRNTQSRIVPQGIPSPQIWPGKRSDPLKLNYHHDYITPLSIALKCDGSALMVFPLGSRIEVLI